MLSPPLDVTYLLLSLSLSRCLSLSLSLCLLCAQAKAEPTTLAVSPRGDMFVVTSLDKKIRVFDYLTGKLKRVYDESVKVRAWAAQGTHMTLDA